MPATVQTKGVLKASTNRVRTSTALQGSAMWENVIGIVNEERGTNAGVEALINAPQRGGGGNYKAKSEARRAAAAEAVMATGGFDTAITSYNELLSLAKSQGAMGEGATRGACKVCGQLGHLTKQCRNQFSKFYQGDSGPSAAAAAAAAGGVSADGVSGAAANGPTLSDDSLSSLGRDSDKLSSDSSSSSSDSDSEEDRRRRRKKKEKKRKRERKEKKRKHKERDHHVHSSGKDKRHKKSKRHRSRSQSPLKKERRD
jgi:hypothetical protein